MTETDIELLREWGRSGSEEAFATVARRHVDLVFSSALRQVRSRELAEEITQAVFVELARSARKLREGSVVAAWLFEVTRRKAVDMIRRETRRKERERIAAEELPMKPEESRWEEIAPVVDEALAELDTHDRAPLLLRFFENQALREVGRALGISEDAAQKRVTRALERLRQALHGRGISATTAGLAGLFAANGVQATPAAFAASVASSAAGSATAAWATKLSLFAMTKTQGAVLAIIAVGLAIPLGTKTIELREARNSAPAASAPIAPHAPENSGAPVESPAAEIARLQNLAAAVREQIAARRTGKASPAPLLRAGVEESLDALVYVGNETPEAALQSFLAFQRDANFDGLCGLMVLPPSQLDEWDEMLGDAEAKEALAGRMRNALFGARISQSTEQLPDGSMAPPRIREEWPDPLPSNVRVKLLDKEVIDERRVRLKLELSGGGEVRVGLHTLGLTARGWKQVM